jgi:hypothetical protein
MSAKRRQREIEVAGQKYQVTFIQRPFREGLEVEVACGDEILRFAELGLGEEAVLEKIRAAILQKTNSSPTD